MGRKRTFQQEIAEQLEEMDYCMYDEGVTFYDIVVMQYILMEALHRHYGISYEESGRLFLKYNAYELIEAGYWILQEGGDIDIADKFIGFIKLAGGRFYYTEIPEKLLMYKKGSYNPERDSCEAVQELLDNIVRLAEHVMYYEGIKKEDAFAVLICTDTFKRFLDGAWEKYIKDLDRVIEQLKLEEIHPYTGI